MIKIIKSNWQMLSICLVSLVMFFPSLFKFFTNDDFFFLKISGNPMQWFNNNFAMFRPLTTQVFYFFGERLFNFNPVGLHIISFLFFFGILFSIYKLSLELFPKKVALPAVFLYAVSATHFGQLYYLAAFQELGMTFFVLLTCLLFLKNKYLLSFVFFVLALMSKETAVVTPMLLVLIYFLQRFSGCKVVNLKKLILYLSPFIICLFAYLVIRFYFYGLATGDSYIWDFSIRKFLNTIMWYTLWSFNIPESVVDFIGPGLHLNPNLLKYWSKEIIPIFTLFTFQIIIVIYAFFKSKIVKLKPVFLFCCLWFIASLLPVVFLPIHKFTYYLTLPLVGVVIFLSYLLVKLKSKIYILFCIVWTITSILTLRLTLETNWIIQGENVAERVYTYFKQNKLEPALKNIVFVDTSEDSLLPWSPTTTLKTILSDKSFFEVFYPDLSSKVNYAGLAKITNTHDTQIIKSRQFLGY